MSEALSLFAALLSALAAAVGAAVSVAQWRQTRAPGPGSPFGAVPGPATSRAPGPPADLAPPAGSGRRSPAPPPQGPYARAVRAPRSRVNVTAAVLGTVSSALAVVGDLVVWSERDLDITERQGPLLNVIMAVMLLSSAVGTVLALFIAVRGLVRRRRGDLRLAAVVFALCLTPWLAFWIADLINSTS